MKNRATSRTVSTFAAALMGGVAALGLMAAGDAWFTADARQQPIVIEAPNGAPVSFADLIEQVSPAVVSVNVITEREIMLPPSNSLPPFLERFGLPTPDDEEDGESEDDRENNRTQRGAGLGSGFLVSSDGYIVTNNHVIEDATEIEVVFEDGRTLTARLVGADEPTDLAVLKVDPENGESFAFVEFSDNTRLRVGDWVVALGNPFGLNSTATAGIISAKGRPDQAGRSSTYVDFLQIDAPINRGNSGGPTFDLSGNVVGVNSAILSPSGGSVGIGFAIPADVASRVVNVLIEDGKVSRGWLGVTIQTVTPEMVAALGLPGESGAIVSEVMPGSPALKSGLRRNDVILGVNGRPVRDSIDLTRQVAGLIVGTNNDFRVLRDGREVLIPVRVDERPRDPNAVMDSGRSGSSGDGDTDTREVEAPLGLTLAAVEGAAAQRFGLQDGESGVLVTDVKRGSWLGERGFDAGVVILEVNGKGVETPEDFIEAIANARDMGKSQVLLAIRVEGRTAFLTAPLDEEAED